MSGRGSSSMNLNVPKEDNDPKKSPSEVGRRKDPQQKGSDKNDSNGSRRRSSSSSHQKSSVAATGSPNQPVARGTTTTPRARNQSESSSGPSVANIHHHSSPGSYFVKDEENRNDHRASSTAKQLRNHESSNFMESTNSTNCEILSNIRMSARDDKIEQLDLKKKSAEPNSGQSAIRTTAGQKNDYLKQGSVQKETPGGDLIHCDNDIQEMQKMDLSMEEKPNDKNKSKK
ncbi:uncharacterized protein LOC133817451 [Humulus lupulus]|uniref:uncharacterized protein LOC133817451 n=1 Tax=Humulus lupulus TaxID=3486 RepID=UPI002B4044DC|nr:uncharacterized protein LOC133817451 [Humulus lupulus]